MSEGLGNANIYICTDEMNKKCVFQELKDAKTFKYLFDEFSLTKKYMKYNVVVVDFYFLEPPHRKITLRYEYDLDKDGNICYKKSYYNDKGINQNKFYCATKRQICTIYKVNIDYIDNLFENHPLNSKHWREMEPSYNWCILAISTAVNDPTVSCKMYREIPIFSIIISMIVCFVFLAWHLSLI